MHAFVINLEQSIDRRRHMESVLKQQKGISYEFIAAIDGRKLSDKEKNTVFNIKKSKAYYAKEILPGEIGCTLSHQKCYKKLLESQTYNYVLILEDDIILKNDISELYPILESVISTEKPTIVLLSGWYWFTSKKTISKKYSLAKVFNAFLTQSYIINKPAAKLLQEDKPFIRADDWRYIIKRGVKVYGISPHIVNQDWSGKLPSTVYEENHYLSGYLFTKIRIYFVHFIMKLLKITGFYEEAE